MQKCTFSQTDDYGNKVAVNHFLLISSRHSESIPDVSDDLGTNHFNAPFLNNVVSVFLYQIPIYSFRHVSLKKVKSIKKLHCRELYLYHLSLDRGSVEMMMKGFFRTEACQGKTRGMSCVPKILSPNP